ncbi:MAG: NAD-dependent epimerase/dehydratase family protein [Acidimicrobiia bacterium]
MVSVAITGVAGRVGQRLLASLERGGDIERVGGLDLHDPPRRSRHLEMHRADVTNAELEPYFRGVDVVVHLAVVGDPVPDAAHAARVNVEGTRRVLEAAAACGVRHVVRVSSATVYGAWPNNPVPITEAAPLRPIAGFGPAVQMAEAERVAADWRLAYPHITHTSLRLAPVMGAGAGHLGARLLCGRRPLRVRGAGAPVQLVHPEDAAGAVALAVRDRLDGAFNVAADGWLDRDHVERLVPRAVPRVPSVVAARVLDRSWSTGFGVAPPTVLPYLTWPWVLSTDRLRAEGWAPVHSNESILLETADALAAAGGRGGPRLRLVAGAGAAVAVVGAVAARRRRRTDAG